MGAVDIRRCDQSNGGRGGVGAGASVFRCIHRRESEGRSERKVGVPLGVICL